jgi:acetolactate synthase-1/2/3 large subunit
VKKLSDYVIKRIAETGVRHIFLLPGGGAMHLVDSVGRSKEIEYVCNLHEQACAIAADAYAQYTNNIGVALVTTGPGGSNTLTGVAAAWIDSTPCLFLSGQVKREDLIGNRGVRQMGFQELNIIQIVKPITKYAVTVMEPDTIRYHLEKAIYLATTGRPGPVWLDIPLDVQSSKIIESSLEGFSPGDFERPSDNIFLKRSVTESIQLINQAERPVILVGNGVRLGKALESFQELIKILNIPCLTTWRTIDFLSEDDPLYIGRPGSVGQRAANFAQQNADLILILGARLDLGQTGYNHKNFARTARKVVVDIDQTEIDKMDMSIDIPVCVDAKSFIQEIIAQKNLINQKERSEWWSRCKEWKNKYPVILPEYWEEKEGVNTYALMDVLSDEMNEDDLLIPGSSGTCAEITMQAFKVKQGMRIFNNPGLGAMGFGIPASIGGCLASGKKKTVCIDGDGGFQLNMQELETVRRLNLPIKFFVLNNSGYASIQATQRTHFNGYFVACNKSSGLTLPNLSSISEAFGIKPVKISNQSDMRQKVREVLEYLGPVVCDVEITPHQVTAPRISSEQTADGTMVSKPLEDLWPFLDREEFRKNMIIS